MGHPGCTGGVPSHFSEEGKSVERHTLCAHLGITGHFRTGMPPARADLTLWSQRLAGECRERLSALLPLRAAEMEFLDRLNDQGKIVPELLTAEPEMQRLLRGHPGLRWKALNVRKHHGLDRESDATNAI